MRAVVVNGSRVGPGSLVAAGALVGEGKEFGPRSLIVGVPGRAIGEVSDELAESISRGADHYVTLARTYLERGIGSPHPPAWQPAFLGRGFPPASELEIARLLGLLVATPGELAAALSGLEPSALDSVGDDGGPSLRWLVRRWLWEEEEFWGPRLERLLTENMPELGPPAEEEPPPLADPAAAVDRLDRSRARHLAVLRELRVAGWQRSGAATTGGPLTVLEHVRQWAESDRSHLRQLATARRRFDR
jgi:hypothetical protein